MERHGLTTNRAPAGATRNTASKTNLTLIHYVFTPKYRGKTFADAERAAAARAYFARICDLYGIQIRALAIQPDHVHALVYIPHTMSVARGAQLMKWFTSVRLRQQYPDLGEQKALWGHRFWSTSVGGGAQSHARYIDQQREKGLPLH